MSNQKKYASLSTLRSFLDNIKNMFATKTEVDEKSKVQIVKTNETGISTENVPTLTIHTMSQEQYEEKLSNGTVDANALYLTPYEEDLSIYATTDEVNEKLSGKADRTHKHTISDITNLQSSLDGKTPSTRTINGKPLTSNVVLAASDVGAASTGHNHNDVYYTESEIDEKLEGKSNTTHKHDNDYDAKGSAADAIAESKEYTDTKTSGLASTTTVNSKISTHNTSTTAHNDIRESISDLSTKLNNFLNVDDTTTDQLSEVLALIDSNKGTLESLTTNKINVSDIVNNLTTSSSSKVLSAAQGAAIKTLIDALQEELDGHGHEIADIDGLTTTLANKADKNHGTHVAYLVAAPLMDGTASAGSKNEVARADHRHPTDTSRAAQTDLDSHTANTTVHITATERTNWNAAKTHADSAHAPSNAEKNQNAFSNVKVGSITIAADTATDTLELVGSNVTITPDATNDKVTIAVASGSTSTAGVVQLTNSTSSTSTTTAATPNSVKSAYDLANTAKTNAATAQTKANDAYDLASVKTDWCQNDASANSYIKNRTHWTSKGTNIIVSQTTQQSVRKDKTGTSSWEPEYDFNKKYVVTVDGVQYQCDPYELDDGYGVMSFTLGDSRLRETPDSSHPEDVPFLVQAYVEDDGGSGTTHYHYWWFSYSSYDTTHTIEIAEAEYHTLDDGFIPNTIQRKIAGIIHQYAGASAPDGYLLCDGSFYRTDEYEELFNAIGFTYGESGSGVNLMFAVPNLATRVPVGVGSGYALGSTGGEATHTLTVSEMPKHDHGAVYSGNATAANKKYPWFTGTGDKIGYQTIETGSGTAHNNMQPYIALNYIISTGK